jgi:hypothetical protein
MAINIVCQTFNDKMNETYLIYNSCIDAWNVLFATSLTIQIYAKLHIIKQNLKIAKMVMQH